MIYTITTFAYPLYDMRVTLDGADFVLLFDYSAREDRYYMTISDTSGDSIYRGIKVVAGVLLLAGCADRRRPAGELVAVSSVDPGVIDWPHTSLTYLDQAEFAAALST